MRRHDTRSLGFDIGDRRIGVALSDPRGILASPLTIIERRDESQDITVLVNLINQNRVTQIVVGLPRTLRGDISEQAEKVKSFAQKLSSSTDVPIEFRDERFTTVLARRLMQANPKRTKRKAEDDAIAAALILQGYLEEKRTD